MDGGVPGGDVAPGQTGPLRSEILMLLNTDSSSVMVKHIRADIIDSFGA